MVVDTLLPSSDSLGFCTQIQRAPLTAGLRSVSPAAAWSAGWQDSQPLMGLATGQQGRSVETAEQHETNSVLSLRRDTRPLTKTSRLLLRHLGASNFLQDASECCVAKEPHQRELAKLTDLLGWSHSSCFSSWERPEGVAREWPKRQTGVVRDTSQKGHPEGGGALKRELLHPLPPAASD